MKLATLKDGSCDGQLAVVSRDLKTAHFATHIVGTLQRALDDWVFHTPQLQDLYNQFNAGRAHYPFAFDTANCMAPLSRAYQRVDGSAYLDHVGLVRKACGAEMPLELWADPLTYQDGPDDLAGVHDPIVCRSEALGIDLEAEVVAITGDVPTGIEAAAAVEGIRLIVLANDVSLRNLISAELGRGFGFFQSRSAASFLPVAVTPDELSDAWRERKVHPPMTVRWNNKKVGQLECGTDTVFDLGQLIAHICKTRNVRTGSIVGSGTISNVDRNKRYARTVEKCMLETIESGASITEYMRYGGTVKVEMLDANGVLILGAIDQEVVVSGTQAQALPYADSGVARRWRLRSDAAAPVTSACP